MPKKIQIFAKSALVKPIIVNVGRAGAASLNVTQDIEYVRGEDKLLKILSALQKTPPKYVYLSLYLFKFTLEC
jgi:ATP-dependent RNA helicase DDX41